MLNFVICDDNRNFSKMMKTEIENFMMNYDQKYKIFHFEGYDDSFEDLKRILNIYNKRHKALSFEYNHIFHKIEFRDIVNIEKEQDSKRCIIRTTYGTIYMPGTLNDIISKLDDRFLKVHRSLIVNKDKIVKYNPKLNKLEFNDGSFTHLISRRKKKELMKCD